MKTLETEIKYQSRTLRQIKREGRIALYELRSAKEMMYGFEVHVIKYSPEHEALGKTFPEQELSPAPEDWGTYGFSYLSGDLAGAEKRFSALRLKYPGNVTPPANKAHLEPEGG